MSEFGSQGHHHTRHETHFSAQKEAHKIEHLAPKAYSHKGYHDIEHPSTGLISSRQALESLQQEANHLRHMHLTPNQISKLNEKLEAANKGPVGAALPKIKWDHNSLQIDDGFTKHTL